MTRTTGLKRPPHSLASAGADPPPAPRPRSQASVTGRKGPPARHIPDVIVIDEDEEGQGDEEDDRADEDVEEDRGVEDEEDRGVEDEEEEQDEEEDREDFDDDVPAADDDSSDEEGFVDLGIYESEEFSKKQLELIQLASDLSANDDLLSCIFVDTFGSMAAKDDLGVYYHQGDFIKPYFNRAELVKMAQETIVQGNVQAALDRSLRLVVFRNRIAGLRSSTQIKKFVAHLKRYLMLYHPSSRVEIRTTDRYRFATQKSELAVHATVDLDPGLTEYVLMDLRDVAGGSSAATNNNNNSPSLNGIPNRVNGETMAAELAQAGIDWTQEPRPPMLVLDEITGAMEVMPKTWEQRLSGNNIEDDPRSAKDAITAAQRRQKPRNVPYSHTGPDDNENAAAGPLSAQQTNGRQKMAEIRDFSVVNSGRQGLMLFLGPGRFINHDCSPNVELITTKRNVITFRVLRRIRVGGELTTWYGDNYFGPGNRDCLCLTCELSHRGGFTRVPDETGSVGSDKQGEPETSKRTSAEARRLAGRASTHISDEVQYEPDMDIRLTEEGMEIGDGFAEDGDDDADPSGRDMVMEAIKKGGLVQDVATQRRSIRRLNSASSLPARMADSMSVSTSARASPETSATGSSPTREPARNKRRAAARGRERTSHMLHNPFGYPKVGKPSGSSTSISNGLEHRAETSDSQVEKDEPGTLRCTVCLQIMEPVWVSNRYVEQCKRCIRHKAIFGFKWPARAKHEEQPYPPVNMRPSWWVPPKISRHRFRSATPPAIQPNNDDDGVQMSDGEREATALEEQARREAKRKYRWQVLQAEAAAKFRKDLEAAQEEMKRIEEEHARQKEAFKSKPTLHTGRGSWGKYEYVWEEEAQPVILQDGTKRSRGATSYLDSHAPALKKRKTNDDAQSGRGSSSGAQPTRDSVNGRNKGKQPVRPRSQKPEEKAHPASRRGQRPKPNGPIFSATPASPSDKVLPGNDFDIMPLTTAMNTTTNDSPIILTDVNSCDSYDSDVEVVATNVARARAVQGGLDKDHFGSNVNPIPLSAEEDEANSNRDDSSDEDLFYSTRFSASALHLMPVTPGSANAGGVPSGTTNEQSTGTGSVQVHSPHTKGISPLKYREIFRGTLSSPDVHPAVQPESYKQPKALTERGKGTRAALEAKERDRSTDPPPLLHSAEAEIARAQQAAAFVESARRKPSRKGVASRSSKHRKRTQVDPSACPTLFSDARYDEGESGEDEQEPGIKDMLDTIVSIQFEDLDTSRPPDATEASARISVELNPTAMDAQHQSPEQTMGSVPEKPHTPFPEPEARGELPPSQQNLIDDGKPAQANSEDTGPLTDPPQATSLNFALADPLLEMAHATGAQTGAVVSSDQSIVVNDISKERWTVATDIGEPVPPNEAENSPIEDVPRISEVQQNLRDQPDGMGQSLEPEATIQEENQHSSTELQLDREAEVEHSSKHTSSIQDLQATEEKDSVVSGTGLSGHLSKELAQNMTTADASPPTTEAVFSSDMAPAEEVITSPRKGLTSSHFVDQMSVAEIPDSNTSDVQDGRDAEASSILPSGGVVADESSASGAAESTALINAPPLSPSLLQIIVVAAVESDQQNENTPAITDEGPSAIQLSDLLSSTHSDLTEAVARIDSVGPEPADISMQMKHTEPSAESMLAQTSAATIIELSNEEMSEPPHQEEVANTTNEVTSARFVEIAEVPMVTSLDVLPPDLQMEPAVPPQAITDTDATMETVADIHLPGDSLATISSLPVPVTIDSPLVPQDITRHLEDKDLATIEADRDTNVPVETPVISSSAAEPVALEDPNADIHLPADSPATTPVLAEPITTQSRLEAQHERPALNSKEAVAKSAKSNTPMEMNAGIDLPVEFPEAAPTELVTAEASQVAADISPDLDMGNRDEETTDAEPMGEINKEIDLPVDPPATTSSSAELVSAQDTVETDRLPAENVFEHAPSIDVTAPSLQGDTSVADADVAPPVTSNSAFTDTPQLTNNDGEPLSPEGSTNPPEPLLESNLPSMRLSPPTATGPSPASVVAQSVRADGDTQTPRAQNVSVSASPRPDPSATSGSANSNKRKRGGNTSIPKGTPIFILSSDDEVEIISPPKKVVLRAPATPSVLPSSRPDRRAEVSTSINPSSLGTPMAQRISVVSSSSITQSSNVPANATPSSSSAAPATTPIATPDARKGSKKGALFLPSTRKALESRRTIEALRRIQLAAAGIAEPREDEPAEQIAADTSATGVDTSWNPEDNASPAIGTAWDSPAEPPTELVSNTGWGDSSVQPAGNDSGWGASAETTTTAHGWSQPPTTSSNVDNGWNIQPTTTPNADDGWNTQAAVTSSTNDGWNTQTVTSSANDEWNTRPETTASSDNTPSTSRTTDARATTSSDKVRPEIASTPSGWGEAPILTPGTDAEFNATVQTLAKSDGWNAAATTNQTLNNGSSHALAHESSKNDGWANATQNSTVDDGWGLPTSAPLNDWATQEKADVTQPSSTTADPNAWEPEPETAPAPIDWSVWDTPSVPQSSSGWAYSSANQASGRWNAPSKMPANGDRGLSNAASTNRPDAVSGRVGDALQAPATKPRRQVAEDFWEHSEPPEATPDIASKVDDGAGWGAWAPSDPSSIPKDDGWGNATGGAAETRWSTGGSWNSAPHNRPTEARDVNQNRSARYGSGLRRTSRERVPTSPGFKSTGHFSTPSDWHDHGATESTRPASRTSSSRRHERSRSRDRPRDRDADEKRSRHSGQESHRKHHDESASGEHRHIERRRSDKEESNQRSVRREYERRHSRERDSDRSEKRYSERREAGEYDRGSERRDRHRSRDREREWDRHQAADRDTYDHERRRAHRSRERVDPEPKRRPSERRDADDRHPERHESRTAESRYSESRSSRSERSVPDGVEAERRRSETRASNKIHPSRRAMGFDHSNSWDSRGSTESAGFEPEPGQINDEPIVAEARSSTNALALGKQRRYGTTSSEPAQRVTPSITVHTEKPHDDRDDTRSERASRRDRFDGVPAEASKQDWGDSTGTATTEQGGWDSWASKSGAVIPQVSAGW